MGREEDGATADFGADTDAPDGSALSALGESSTDGRPLGRRAVATRRRLLEATHKLLTERSVLDISVAEIAREAGTSPATFYHYFKEVDEAVLLLALQASEEMPAIVALIEGPWQGSAAMDKARALVTAFIDHWDTHHAVLSLRNLSADRGDARFQEVRRRALSPLLEELARQVDAGKQAGRVSGELEAHIAAAALAAILERLAAHYRELKTFEADRVALVETCARILCQTVTGRAPR